MVDDRDWDGTSVPPGWHPNGLLAGLSDMIAAGANTLGGVMTPEQQASVDWGDTPKPSTPPWTVTGESAGLVPLAGSSLGSQALTGAPNARGTAPDPGAYAQMGEMARELQNNSYDPDGNTSNAGLMYNAGQMLEFHRGGNLDAQHYGASPPYGNYAFGVYTAAAGIPLSGTLDLANTYGKYFSKYPTDPKAPGYKPMDENYQHIPAENVDNITTGYNDYQNGTFSGTP